MCRTVTVDFGSATYTVAEGGTVAVTVTLSADPERTVVIPVTAAPTHPATSADYIVPTSVTFNAGETSKQITFNANQDTFDDDEDSVVLAFGSGLPALVSEGTTAETTVTITDDDHPTVTVDFGSATYTVAEGGTVAVTVTLSADPERTVVIPVTATPTHPATSADYIVPTSVTFTPGETSKEINFTARQDTFDDDEDSVVVGFGSTLPTGVSQGTTAQTTVTITDDDVPEVTVSFGSATYTVAEGGTVNVTVTLSADPERTVQIPLTATPQGDTTTADYTVPTSVTFNAGETSKQVTFTANQDTVDDDEDSVVLSFGTMPDTRVSEGTTAQTTVTITDDDHPTVTVEFGSATYTVAEGGNVAMTVTLSADPERTVTIPVTATPTHPATTADYTVPTSVTFNAGETSKEITFTANQDTSDDDEDSVVLGFGSTLPPGVSQGTTSQTTVTITDDDHPTVTVEFGSATYTVAEGGTVNVTVTLSADPERTVTIPVTATPTHPATTADYTVPTSVTFNAGETSKEITFTANQDTVDDDEDSVVLGFGSTLPTGVSQGTTSQTTVTITDDDVPEVTVEFGSATYTVAEGGSIQVTVTLSADPERTVDIPVTATPTHPATSADYTVPTSVTFNAGETSKEITFTANQDTFDDDEDSVVLGFGSSLRQSGQQGNDLPDHRHHHRRRCAGR